MLIQNQPRTITVFNICELISMKGKKKKREREIFFELLIFK